VRLTRKALVSRSYILDSGKICPQEAKVNACDKESKANDMSDRRYFFPGVRTGIVAPEPVRVFDAARQLSDEPSMDHC
jgi:hypothetical protein